MVDPWRIMFEAQDAALPPLFRYVARIPSRTALSSAIQTTPPRSGDALFLDHPHRRSEGPAGRHADHLPNRPRQAPSGAAAGVAGLALPAPNSGLLDQAQLECRSVGARGITRPRTT